MNLTEKLRAYAVEKLGVAADATDDEFRSAINEALKAGTLAAEEFAAMLADKGQAKEELAKLVADSVGAAMGPVAESLRTLGEAVTGLKTGQQTPPPVDDPPPADDGEQHVSNQVKRLVDEHMARHQMDRTERSLASRVIAKGANVRVKSPIERYDRTKGVAVYPETSRSGKTRHPFAGQPARLGAFGKTLDRPSQADNALIGAFCKMQMYAMHRMPIRLNEHEEQLVAHLLHECDWRGTLHHEEGPEINGRLGEFERKAVIDDTTSGGSYAVPDVFDEAIVLTPVLFGELFPMVEVVDLPRGSSVDGMTMSKPSVAWGTSEGSSTSVLQSTASLIGNLDTTIFPVVSVYELGLDWESDTPLNFGQILTQQLGLVLMETLDEQIAIGDGTQEPTGIFTASGVTSVSSTNGTSGPFAIADAEALMFGLAKEYRNAKGGNCCFVCTDEGYRRARAVPVGSSDDRRVFGMDHAAYHLMDVPVKIQDDITEGSYAYTNLAYYRMYRRLGLQFRATAEGQNLILKNTRMIAMRARYGGQPTLGASIAKMTDGPQTG